MVLIDNTSISNYNENMKTDNSINLISRIRDKSNKYLLKEMETLGLQNIALSHADILAALFRYEEATMTEIADIIHRERSTVTTLVNKLIKLGYISSKKDINDSRSSIIYLTEKGHKLKSGFEEISQKLYIREYEGVSDEEKVIFQRVLKKIYDNF